MIMKTKRFFIGILSGLFITAILFAACKRLVEKVIVEPSEVNLLNIGDTCHLKAIIKPDNAKNKTIIWKSADERVSTVENGLVIAVDEGYCSISCIAEDGNILGKSTIMVGDIDGTYTGILIRDEKDTLSVDAIVNVDRKTDRRADFFIPQCTEKIPYDISIENTPVNRKTNDVIAPSLTFAQNIEMENHLGEPVKIRFTGSYIYGFQLSFRLEIGAIPYDYIGRKE
jgi:hypothetical protein